MTQNEVVLIDITEDDEPSSETKEDEDEIIFVGSNPADPNRENVRLRRNLLDEGTVIDPLYIQIKQEVFEEDIGGNQENLPVLIKDIKKETPDPDDISASGDETERVTNSSVLNETSKEKNQCSHNVSDILTTSSGQTDSINREPTALLNVSDVGHSVIPSAQTSTEEILNDTIRECVTEKTNVETESNDAGRQTVSAQELNDSVSSEPVLENTEDTELNGAENICEHNETETAQEMISLAPNQEEECDVMVAHKKLVRVSSVYDWNEIFPMVSNQKPQSCDYNKISNGPSNDLLSKKDRMKRRRVSCSPSPEFTTNKRSRNAFIERNSSETHEKFVDGLLTNENEFAKEKNCEVRKTKKNRQEKCKNTFQAAHEPADLKKTLAKSRTINKRRTKSLDPHNSTKKISHDVDDSNKSQPPPASHPRSAGNKCDKNNNQNDFQKSNGSTCLKPPQFNPYHDKSYLKIVIRRTPGLDMGVDSYFVKDPDEMEKKRKNYKQRKLKNFTKPNQGNGWKPIKRKRNLPSERGNDEEMESRIEKNPNLEKLITLTRTPRRYKRKSVPKGGLPTLAYPKQTTTQSLSGTSTTENYRRLKGKLIGENYKYLFTCNEITCFAFSILDKILSFDVPKTMPCANSLFPSVPPNPVAPNVRSLEETDPTHISHEELRDSPSLFSTLTKDKSPYIFFILQFPNRNLLTCNAINKRDNFLLFFDLLDGDTIEEQLVKKIKSCRELGCDFKYSSLILFTAIICNDIELQNKKASDRSGPHSEMQPIHTVPHDAGAVRKSTVANSQNVGNKDQEPENHVFAGICSNMMESELRYKLKNDSIFDCLFS